MQVCQAPPSSSCGLLLVSQNFRRTTPPVTLFVVSACIDDVFQGRRALGDFQCQLGPKRRFFLVVRRWSTDFFFARGLLRLASRSKRPSPSHLACEAVTQRCPLQASADAFLPPCVARVR